MSRSWADIARETIRETIAAGPGLDWEAMLAKVDAAYPFGQRKHWPYKMWLQERAKAMSEYASMIGDGEPTRRVCPACGAGLGRACSEINAGKRAFPDVLSGLFHESRRKVAAPSGPLFAGVEGST